MADERIGGRMLFDARQATSAARRQLSFATQRLLFPLLGHPLIETAFRADPLTWSVVARFLVRAAVQAAKRTNWADSCDEQLDDEQVDDWYKKHWSYKMEASGFLQDTRPEAPDDPAEFALCPRP